MDNKQILVVEDDGIIALTLKNRLTSLGYRVPATVFSGEEALAQAAELHPDLVLMDIHIRGAMDGIQTADRIRAEFDIPVIYLTAYADEETLQRAKITEPYGYILKPFQERELHTAIEIALYKHQAEKQLRQAEKLEAVGLLTAGVAHHYNNLMAVVVGYSGLLLDSYHQDENLRKPLEAMRRAGERAAALTHQLLAFARTNTLDMAVQDLNIVLAGLLAVLQHRNGTGIHVEFLPAPEPAYATVDASMIEQVLVNLADNARQAMPQGGQFSLRVQNVTLSEAEAAAIPEAYPGRFVYLTATDTGTGMDAKTLSQALEPFFSIDPERLGLGLSVAYGIVKQHGGWFHIQSAPGQGTTVGIYLPAAE